MDTLPDPTPIDVEQAEAALVEHYPQLVRLAYLVLPPSLGRNRRVLTAHSLTQRALPRSRSFGDTSVLQDRHPEGGGARYAGYALVRLRVVSSALEAARPLRGWKRLRRSQFPPLLPQVWGLRLFPRSGGADELALDQRLSALDAPARAAFVLRGLEDLTYPEIRTLLAAAGVEEREVEPALTEADALDVPGPREPEATGTGAPRASALALLRSPEFDPCLLLARPPDLMRRRQHVRAAFVATAALLVCGALLGLPGEGWGPEGAAAPAYAQNPASQAALDPAKLTRAAPDAWRTSARTDLSVWPARGSLTDDRALLRRALAVWARPGGSVQVSATPGTPSGAPPGPAQLLYAGTVDAARVVLLYDGMRVVRYAEPVRGTSGAALDFARVDGADIGSAGAVVAGRSDNNVRYLTAPWVRSAAVRDLLKPEAEPEPLRRDSGGVTAPLAGPAGTGACRSWRTLELRDDGATRVLADLGELAPAHLTAGTPGAAREVSGASALADWSRVACSLPAMRSHGVRTVNSWQFARQTLPEGNGAAAWVCTRADTWRGHGSRVLAQFLAPGRGAGAVAAKAEDSPACGGRASQVLAGVLWKSQAGRWYLLAAGSEQVASIATSGQVSGRARGRVLAVPAEQGARAELNGVLKGGAPVSGLH